MVESKGVSKVSAQPLHLCVLQSAFNSYFSLISLRQYLDRVSASELCENQQNFRNHICRDCCDPR